MKKRTYIIKKASIPVAVQRITWSFESNRSRLIVETMDNELNLQAKERVNLNALKRIENPHHETPLPLYSIQNRHQFFLMSQWSKILNYLRAKGDLFYKLKLIFKCLAFIIL